MKSLLRYEKLTILLVMVLLLSVICFGISPRAADVSNPEKAPFMLLSVATDANLGLDVPDGEVSITHLNKKADFSASGTSDYVIIMTAYTDTGAAVTMDADSSDGTKVALLPGATVTLKGDLLKKVGGKRTLLLRAVTGSAKIQVVNGARQP